MCGRYTLSEPDNLSTRFNALPAKVKLIPRYNIAPGQFNPTITRRSPNKIEVMEWGIIPYWVKNDPNPFKMINVRAETLREKPTFKKIFATQRCIVPADGFYEWRKQNNSKTPYYFKLKNDEVFGFAGLYDVVETKGETYFTYTIITTEPNSLVAPVHNRMPVILEKNKEDTWLDNTDVIELLTLLDPYPAGKMERIVVSKEVNNTSNDNPTLLEEDTIS